MKKRVASVLGVALLGWLFFWPIDEAPMAWVPPPLVEAPLNEALKTAEWLHRELPGPEAIAFDAEGGLITGLHDGRVVKVTGEKVETLLDNGGRKLGLKYGPDGRLYLCDAYQGLMVLNANGKAELLSGGMKFADDLDFAADGTVYFSDASRNHGVERAIPDLLEHQLTGRLLKYEPQTRKTTVVAEGFQFANGVAFGPDPAWVVVAETGSYRLTKVYVADGRKETFADSLPGFPDNVTWSKGRQVFWVAFGSPRNALADALAPYPFLRKAVLRLPKALQPAPVPHATVLAFDATGKRVENLQFEGAGAYSPIASVIEHDGYLYLGSYKLGGYARWRVP